jgi:hypothetical protein
MHLTPYLALVLAAFATFIAALGPAWLQGWIAERRASRDR